MITIIVIEIIVAAIAMVTVVALSIYAIKHTTSLFKIEKKYSTNLRKKINEPCFFEETETEFVSTYRDGTEFHQPKH